MTTVDIHVEWPDRAKFFAASDFTPKVRQFADNARFPIVKSIHDEAPKRTGKLAESYQGVVTPTPDGADLHIETGVNYAPYVVRGTRPHRIEAHRAGALHWRDSAGMDAFAKFVNHPGTRPNHFVYRAVDRMMPELRTMFREAVIRGFE